MERKINPEKRKDLRIEIDEPLAIKCHIKKKSDLLNLLGKVYSSAENMSVGGMRMELPLLDSKEMNRVIEGKDKLILELDVPGLKRPLKVTGKIAWLKKRDRRGNTHYVAGVSFENLKAKDREKILSKLVSTCVKEGGSVDKGRE